MIRLADDAFAHVCNSVNDLVVRVRALAAELLGSMQNVSEDFLQQTLDKKLMSNMRVSRLPGFNQRCFAGNIEEKVAARASKRGEQRRWWQCWRVQQRQKMGGRHSQRRGTLLMFSVEKMDIARWTGRTWC